MTGTIKKKGNSKGVKSGSKVADAIIVAMAASIATGAKAERPGETGSAGGLEFEVMMLIIIFMVAILAFLVGRLWSRKTEQDLADKVENLNGKAKHAEEVAKLAREDASHWEEAVSRAQWDIDQIRSRRFYMARRGARLHFRPQCQYLQHSQIELRPCELCAALI